MSLDSVQEYILLNKIGMCINDPVVGEDSKSAQLKHWAHVLAWYMEARYEART